MLNKQNRSCQQRSERGQSTITIAISLSVLLLLIIGMVVLCMALFTASTLEDYDEGDGLFEDYETQSNHDISPDTFALNAYGLQFLPAYSDIPSAISSIDAPCI